MPVQKDSKLAIVLEALLAWLPTVRVRLGEWWQTCRAEPILFWQTPAVRFGVYGCGGAIAIWFISTLLGALSPGGPEPVPFAKTADFHIVCSNRACGAHYVIQRKFNFDDFPVKCRDCGKETGEHGRRCFSATCKGAWVAPIVRDDKLYCPSCGHFLGPSD